MNSDIKIDLEINTNKKAKPKVEYSKKEYIKTTIGDKEVILNKAKLESYLNELINSNWEDGKMRGCYYLTSLCKLLGYERDKALSILHNWASRYGNKYIKHIGYEVKYLYDNKGKVCSIKWLKENIPEAKTQIEIYKKYYEME